MKEIVLCIKIKKDNRFKSSINKEKSVNCQGTEQSSGRAIPLSPVVALAFQNVKVFTLKFFM